MFSEIKFEPNTIKLVKAKVFYLVECLFYFTYEYEVEFHEKFENLPEKIKNKQTFKEYLLETK